MLDSRRPRRVAGYELIDGQGPDAAWMMSHPATQRAIYSNRTGALIWALCDGTRTLAEIADLLARAYPASAAEVQSDVRQTVLAFSQFGALEWT